MTKISECMNALRKVLNQNDPDSVKLAEVAIDRLLTDTLLADRFLVVSALKSAILKATENLPSRSAGLIFDLIENRERALQNNMSSDAEGKGSGRHAGPDN